MTILQTDTFGHEVQNPNNQLSFGAVGTSAAGTISATTKAGNAPVVDFTVATNAGSGYANDRGGIFHLNPVTSGGGQSAGDVVIVKFANAYAKPPIVFVTILDDAATTTPIPAQAGAVTATGFSVCVTSALTTAHNYTVMYMCFLP
jgi:hypothetical protein